MMFNAMKDNRNILISKGFQANFVNAPVHVRWLGKPRASGRRQAIFTCQDLPTAIAANMATWYFWRPTGEDTWCYLCCHWYGPHEDNEDKAADEAS